jgi:hypothetical protein
MTHRPDHMLFSQALEEIVNHGMDGLQSAPSGYVQFWWPLA